MFCHSEYQSKIRKHYKEYLSVVSTVIVPFSTHFFAVVVSVNFPPMPIGLFSYGIILPWDFFISSAVASSKEDFGVKVMCSGYVC